MDSELLHSCIEEFDRIVFHVPQEFTINEDDQLNHFIEGTIVNSVESNNSSRWVTT